jgi:hypothetical protein
MEPPGSAVSPLDLSELPEPSSDALIGALVGSDAIAVRDDRENDSGCDLKAVVDVYGHVGHSSEAVQSGLDLNFPGGGRFENDGDHTTLSEQVEDFVRREGRRNCDVIVHPEACVLAYLRVVD